MYVWVEPLNSIEDCGNKEPRKKRARLLVGLLPAPPQKRGRHRHRQVILECSQCSTRGSHYSYCFPQMLHDDAHHSIGETTGVGAQAPGSGSERTAAFCGYLEAQRALGDGGHAGLTSRGQVSEAEVNTWMLHGYTVELLRRPSGHILTLSNERVAKRFCLATMQHFGEAHQWTDAQHFSG